MRHLCKIGSFQVCQSPQVGDPHTSPGDVLLSEVRFSSRSVRLFLDRGSGCYLLMLMMWPSSTFRSFIDLYASRVQMDRAKTFTCRGRGDRFGFSWTLSLAQRKEVRCKCKRASSSCPWVSGLDHPNLQVGSSLWRLSCRLQLKKSRHRGK